MTTGWKIGLALAGVYLAVPVVRRLQTGCPVLSAITKTIPVVGGGTTTVVVCRPMTAQDLFLWPLGLFAPRK